MEPSKETTFPEPDINLNAPCITVSLSTNEMHQVLESGNSLEVVFNEDHLARKSGGENDTVHVFVVLLKNSIALFIKKQHLCSKMQTLICLQIS